MRNLLAHKYLLLIATLYTMLITWLSTAKIFFPIKVNVLGGDKIGHFLAYAVFTVVWFFFFLYSERIHQKFAKSLWLASILGFFYGIVMEGCQALFTDYRNPDWNDVVANVSGTIFAIIILMLFRNNLIALKGKLFRDR